ncbi:MAG: hypothetical protein KGI54_08425 [Pseudomonadota bacterium]|nr:hypothetical protein [Pseudomonadota bacterium]
MTQLDQLREHMQEVGEISQIEAASLYKVRSLTKQMSNLRKEGMSLLSQWKTDITGQRYVRYRFLGWA